MASRQSRFMVGLFVIIGSIIGVAATIWLGAANYFQKGTRYVTYFDESVQGLQVDSGVKYRGVEIGRVERIGVAPDQKLVEVVVKIDLVGDVQRTIVSQLKAAGITGIVFVELDIRQPEEKILVPPPDMATLYPVIPSQPSQTKQMLSSIDRIMEKIGGIDLKGVAEQIGQTARSMEIFVSGREMTSIVQNLETTTASLQRNLERIDKILAQGSVEAILSSIDKGVGETRQGIEEVRQGVGEARQGIGETREGIRETRDGIAEARKFIATITREIEQLRAAEIAGKTIGLIDGLDRRTKAMAVDIQLTTDEIRQATDSIKMLFESLRENPSDLLFSEPAKDRRK